MDSRDVPKPGIGFYVGIALWALLKSLYGIHVLLAKQLANNVDCSPCPLGLPVLLTVATRH